MGLARGRQGPVNWAYYPLAAATLAGILQESLERGSRQHCQPGYSVSGRRRPACGATAAQSLVPRLAGGLYQRDGGADPAAAAGRRTTLAWPGRPAGWALWDQHRRHAHQQYRRRWPRSPADGAQPRQLVWRDFAV